MPERKRRVTRQSSKTADRTSEVPLTPSRHDMLVTSVPTSEVQRTPARHEVQMTPDVIQQSQRVPVLGATPVRPANRSSNDSARDTVRFVTYRTSAHNIDKVCWYLWMNIIYGECFYVLPETCVR